MRPQVTCHIRLYQLTHISWKCKVGKAMAKPFFGVFTHLFYKIVPYVVDLLCMHINHVMPPLFKKYVHMLCIPYTLPTNISYPIVHLSSTCIKPPPPYSHEHDWEWTYISCQCKNNWCSILFLFLLFLLYPFILECRCSH